MDPSWTGAGQSFSYRGGRTKPPNSRPTRPANRIGVRSSRYGPIACRPIGSPPRVRPAGDAVARWADRVAPDPPHKPLPSRPGAPLTVSGPPIAFGRVG